jgi:hypothetical protein
MFPMRTSAMLHITHELDTIKSSKFHNCTNVQEQRICATVTFNAFRSHVTSRNMKDNRMRPTKVQLTHFKIKMEFKWSIFSLTAIVSNNWYRYYKMQRCLGSDN